MWVSMFDVFWVLFGLVVVGGRFWPQVSILCVFVWLGVFVICTVAKKYFNKYERMYGE